jgi:hypothetical protein
VALQDIAGVPEEITPERAWWLRVAAVLLSPRPVFFALREDDPDDVVARSEPILLLIWLAGCASFLGSPLASRILDNPEYDGIILAIWLFIGGGLNGAACYFIFGFALYFGALLLGSQGTFLRERQTIAFAAAPLALSFVVLLPIRLALYGGDTFRAGGADEGAGETVLLVAQLAFAAWSLGLLVLGVRVVHGWDWLRTLAAVAAATALVATIVAFFVLVI